MGRNNQFRARGVVALQSSWRRNPGRAVKNGSKGAKVIFCDRAVTQDVQAVAQNMNDRGFNAMATRTAIKDKGNAAVEFGGHMCCARGADPTKAVRTWSGKGFSKGFHNGLKNWMRAPANGDCVLAVGHNIRNHQFSWNDHGQWAGPEFFCQFQSQRRRICDLF